MPPSQVQTPALELTEAPARTKRRAYEAGRVYRVTGWRYWLLFMPAALFLALYYKTLRVRFETEEDREAALYNKEPFLIVIWHNRSLVMPAVFQRIRDLSQIACLVSPSKMASWEAAFFEFLKLKNIRGSTTRRSIHAAREMIKAYKEGSILAISPDGPSGPRYSVQRGAVMIARQTGGRMLLASADCKWAWRPKTWDRHLVPLPFAKVTVRCRLTDRFSELGYGDDSEAAEGLQRDLLELTSDRF